MDFLIITYFRVKNEMQTEVVTAFLDTFQLDPDEINALHGSKLRKDTPITNDIFIALDKVQKISNNCKLLMQYGHQTLGLDIMEQMTLHQVICVFTFLSKNIVVIVYYKRYYALAFFSEPRKNYCIVEERSFRYQLPLLTTTYRSILNTLLLQYTRFWSNGMYICV